MVSGIRCQTVSCKLRKGTVISCPFLPFTEVTWLHRRKSDRTEMAVLWHSHSPCIMSGSFLLSPKDFHAQRCSQKMWKLMILRSMLPYSSFVEQCWKATMVQVLGSWTRPRRAAVNRQDSMYLQCPVSFRIFPFWSRQYWIYWNVRNL